MNAKTDSRSTVAVLGNPNTGKSTLFNSLTGVRQQTGNFPGVTTERRTGHVSFGNQSFELIDLPGTYSLAPRSPDEMLTVNVLMGLPPADKPPDMVLCVVDADNLERNLFLVSQLLDLRIPMVLAVNMIDVASRHGKSIDFDGLSTLLGIPVVAVQANRKLGFDQLGQAMLDVKNSGSIVEHQPFSNDLKSTINQMAVKCPAEIQARKFVVTRLLFDTDGFMSNQLKSQVGDDLLERIRVARQGIRSSNVSLEQTESSARHDWIEKNVSRLVTKSDRNQKSFTDRIDAWLTHPVWGLIVAVALLVVVFQLVFWAAEPASALIDTLNGFLAGLVNAVIPAGAFNSLLIDGLINGVGSVLIFLPQILLLFFILGFLEDTGYLARAAYLLDKYLSRVGLSGITMFPLLSSFACAIPGIMATRVIKNERERLITILIAPLMSCSARLPVYVLMIAAFVPEQNYLGGIFGLRGLVMFAMYGIGIVAGIIVAWVLRKTILNYGSSSFVLELPTYKVPSLRNIFRRMYDGGWAFIRDAGTMIVVVTIIVWASVYFPRIDVEKLSPALAADLALVENGPQPDSGSVVAQAQNRLDAHQLQNSYLGRAGKWIEPIVKPLGWDWRIGSAAIASFPAREVVVSTMGVIFGLGSDTDEASETLRESLKSAVWPDSGKPLFTLPVALSIMVFFALCAQCVSTLAVIRRETNSYLWPIFTFVYMTVLAYAAAFITYNVSNVLM